MLCNLAQYKKALLPIEVRLIGNITLTNELKANVLSAIEVKDVLLMSIVSMLQSQKDIDPKNDNLAFKVIFLKSMAEFQNAALSI
jgi:hypothetical protein